MARILIVDDEVAICKVLSRFLERLGYEVESVHNGRKAVDVFKNGHYDLVMTDMIMPEKDGVEIIRDLRSFKEGVRIVGMSGGGQIGTMSYLKTAKLVGADATIQKPFNLHEIKEIVENLLAS